MSTNTNSLCEELIGPMEITRNKIAAWFLGISCLAGVGGGVYGGYEVAGHDIKSQRLNRDDAFVERAGAMFCCGILGLMIGPSIGGIGVYMIKRGEKLPEQG